LWCQAVEAETVETVENVGILEQYNTSTRFTPLPLMYKTLEMHNFIIAA